MVEVSVLSQHQCQPREGHLAALYRIFWYLRCKKKEISGLIVFDSATPNINDGLFTYNDPKTWKEFYPDAEGMMTIHIVLTNGNINNTVGH